MKPLTTRQQRFVEEYMINLNASAAAIRAGYSPKTARFIGHENLTKPNIQAAVTEARIRLAKRSEVTLDWVVAQYMKIASATIFDYLDFHPDGSVTPKMANILRDLGTGVAEYSEDEVRIESAKSGQIRVVKRHIKLRLANKLTALQALGKHLGMFEGNSASNGSRLRSPRRSVVIENGPEGDHISNDGP